MKAVWVWSFVALVSVVFAETHYCNSSSQCPESAPCCSQYGLCGNGSYCLGGCDPRFSYNISACMPMPILTKLNTTFSSTDDIEKQDKYLGNATEADWIYTGYIDDHDDALLLQMPNGTTGTVLSSTQYLWYGRVSAKLKTSRTRGVITAFILFSDVQDEIDFEYVGYNLTFPQTNYYSKGFLDYHNAKDYEASDTYANWHLYEIDWSEEKVDWLIDGNVVRTLNRSDTWNETTGMYKYPQTPSRVQLSLWPGGAALNAIGTIEWAGGTVDWNAEDIKEYGYFYAQCEYVSIVPYDIPDGVKRIGCNGTLCNAFMYNSTEGNQQNVTMVKKKTYLGNGGATGLDPDNDDEVVSTIKSGSTTKTVTLTKSKQTSKLVVPTGTGTTATQEANPIPTNYHTEDGFVQNSEATNTGAGNGQNGLSQNGVTPQFNIQGLVGIASAMVFGVLSFLA